MRVEVEVVEQGLRGLLGRRLARAQLAVDVEQRVVLAGGVVLLQGVPDRLVVAELLEDLVVGPAERLEEHGDRLLALAVDADADHVALVDLELEPGTTARDDLGREDVLVGGLVRRALEVDARAADELGDDDALGAVDDEGAALGHEREVAHEDRLALDLTGGVVHELGGDEQGRGVGEVALLAVLDRVLELLEAVVAEGQRHRAAEVLDRGDLLEDLLEAGAVGDVVPALGLGRGDPGLPALVAEQPVEALGLQGQEVGDLERLADLREGETAGDRHCGVHVLGRGARGSQGGFLPQACSDFWAGRTRPDRTTGPPAAGPPGTTGGMATRRLSDERGKVGGSAKRQHTRERHDRPARSSLPARATAPRRSGATRTGWRPDPGIVKAGARIGDVRRPRPVTGARLARRPRTRERAGPDRVVRTRPFAAWRQSPEGTGSLEGDGGAGALELLLGLLGGRLVDLLEDGLGGAVDEVLGLLETEGRERADLLDDLDLLVAGGLEDDVELVLLLGGGGLGGATGGGRRRRRRRPERRR